MDRRMEAYRCGWVDGLISGWVDAENINYY
jgi:hypothetical protein